MSNIPDAATQVYREEDIVRDQRPLILIVLDGWGINPRPEGNAIARAATPVMDRRRRPVSVHADLDLRLGRGLAGRADGKLGSWTYASRRRAHRLSGSHADP